MEFIFWFCFKLETLNEFASLAFILQGYDISFLITNYHCEEMQKQKLIDFIVQFMEVRILLINYHLLFPSPHIPNPHDFLLDKIWISLWLHHISVDFNFPSVLDLDICLTHKIASDVKTKWLTHKIASDVNTKWQCLTTVSKLAVMLECGDISCQNHELA